MATVRYVSSTSGVKVRNTPAGTVVATLYAGNLMYELPNINHENASLSGENYEWAKVHYYLVGSTVSEGEGWVAIDFTTVASLNDFPSAQDTFSSNTTLTQYQQLVNAWYIYNHLIGLDWSANAICAMLGNMEAESTINPGRWQSLNDTSQGYGLTQWTPATKLITWAEEHNYEKSLLSTQIKRIEYELAHNEQWDSRFHSPTMTFLEFYKSTEPVSTLAEYFVRCYENPENVNSKVATRQQNAMKWSTIFNNL